MTDTHTEGSPAHSAFKVLAALAELGQATAAEVAEHAGLGYSTTTPKLRAWEGSRQAERFRTGDGRTLWRLTDAGRAATATTATPQPAAADAPAPAADPEVAQLDAAEARLQPGDADPPAAADTTGPSSSDTASQQQPELDAPDAQESTAGNVADKRTDPACQAPADSHDSSDGPRGEDRSAARRRGGSLRGAVLDILEAHPDRAYRTGELCKLIDAANAGTGAAKASAGAVANAAIKLVATGTAVQTVERPATFQLAPASGGE
ncbi:MarR family transcriptional regulator [Micromonospora chersina]